MQRHTDIKNVCGDKWSDEHTEIQQANMQGHTDIKQMCRGCVQCMRTYGGTDITVHVTYKPTVFEKYM